jgi:hypothetical protein
VPIPAPQASRTDPLSDLDLRHIEETSPALPRPAANPLPKTMISRPVRTKKNSGDAGKAVWIILGVVGAICLLGCAGLLAVILIPPILAGIKAGQYDRERREAEERMRVPVGFSPPVSPVPQPVFDSVPTRTAELTDWQKKDIYSALKSYDRSTEHFGELSGTETSTPLQREMAERSRRKREEGRRQVIATIMRSYGITEAQIAEIYETGNREGW